MRNFFKFIIRETFICKTCSLKALTSLTRFSFAFTSPHRFSPLFEFLMFNASTEIMLPFLSLQMTRITHRIITHFSLTFHPLTDMNGVQLEDWEGAEWDILDAVAAMGGGGIFDVVKDIDP